MLYVLLIVLLFAWYVLGGFLAFILLDEALDFSPRICLLAATFWPITGLVFLYGAVNGMLHVVYNIIRYNEKSW